MEAHSNISENLEKPSKILTECSKEESGNNLGCPGAIEEPENKPNLPCLTDFTDNSIVEEIEDNTSVSNTSIPTEDPYAYIDRNGFTSEKFKIEVRGLPKFYGIGVSILLCFPCLL